MHLIPSVKHHSRVGEAVHNLQYSNLSRLKLRHALPCHQSRRPRRALSRPEPRHSLATQACRARWLALSSNESCPFFALPNCQPKAQFESSITYRILVVSAGQVGGVKIWDDHAAGVTSQGDGPRMRVGVRSWLFRCSCLVRIVPTEMYSLNIWF